MDMSRNEREPSSARCSNWEVIATAAREHPDEWILIQIVASESDGYRKRTFQRPILGWIDVSENRTSLGKCVDLLNLSQMKDLTQEGMQGVLRNVLIIGVFIGNRNVEREIGKLLRSLTFPVLHEGEIDRRTVMLEKIRSLSNNRPLTETFPLFSEQIHKSLELYRKKLLVETQGISKDCTELLEKIANCIRLLHPVGVS